MSLKKAKSHLLRILKSDSNVVALSGKWGSGKTHLWNEVQRESSDEKIKKALYVSLFGITNIDEVKRKLIENAIPKTETHKSLFKGLQNLGKVAFKAASEYYKALAALSDINVLLLAPNLFKDATIVIDDIERKHDSLGIDEILGFIDEYSKQYGTRFILLLNDNQLGDANKQEELWTKFREKVIDQEVKLTISSEEAFIIASTLVESPYREALRQTIVKCGLSNIRIVIKIIKVANQILDRRELDEIVQWQVIPSVVLFSAIYYRGIENGPDFDFALKAGTTEWYGRMLNKQETPTEEDNIKAGWRGLMQALGIHKTDEFELHLVEYLETGIYEKLIIDAILTRYHTEKNKLTAEKKAQNFNYEAFWNHRLSDGELLSIAKEFLVVAPLLSASSVSGVADSVQKLEGGEKLSIDIIDEWIKHFKTSDTVFSDFSYDNMRTFTLGIKLHPEISRVYEEMQAKVEKDTSVIDACIHIAEKSGWGTTQRVVMQSTTVDDFIAAIKVLPLDKLRVFMNQMINISAQPDSYKSHFGSAGENFVSACQILSKDKSSLRLAQLIKNLFEQSSLAGRLLN